MTNAQVFWLCVVIAVASPSTWKIAEALKDIAKALRDVVSELQKIKGLMREGK